MERGEVRQGRWGTEGIQRSHVIKNVQKSNKVTRYFLSSSNNIAFFSLKRGKGLHIGTHMKTVSSGHRLFTENHTARLATPLQVVCRWGDRSKIIQAVATAVSDTRARWWDLLWEVAYSLEVGNGATQVELS